jgi:hypothetical protein
MIFVMVHINMIKISRFEWLGLVEQREEGTLINKIYKGKIRGRMCKVKVDENIVGTPGGEFKIISYRNG